MEKGLRAMIFSSWLLHRLGSSFDLEFLKRLETCVFTVCSETKRRLNFFVDNPLKFSEGFRISRLLFKFSIL